MAFDDDHDDERTKIKKYLLAAIEDLSDRVCFCGQPKRWVETYEHMPAACSQCGTSAGRWLPFTDTLRAAYKIGGPSAVRDMIDAGRS